MNFEDLTPEQQERARNAKTPEEILALAQEKGYELSDEELESISGGGGLSWTGNDDRGGCIVCQRYYGCKNF